MTEIDYYDFLNMSAEEMKENWLDFITARDPLVQDRSDYTFNAVLAEAVAAQFWIYVQLLKQLQIDTNPMTATGAKLSALVLDRLPEGRYEGTRSAGAVTFSRSSAATMDYTIPAGSVVAGIGEDGTFVKFETIAIATLLTGTTSITVNARSASTGADKNVPQYTVRSIVTPVYGISSVTNDLPFIGGTDEEADDDLRRRYIYAIWEEGRATAPMMEEHIDSLEPVREVLVSTLGQGDALIVVDLTDGVESAAEVIEDVRAEIEDEVAAGVTAPGILAATLRSDGHTFEIGDTSGGKVWVRSRQYLSNPVSIEFTYTDQDAAPKTGTITMPAGTPEGGTVLAVMAETTDLAVDITASTYAGALSFDLYLGLGTYPHCFVCPELQDVDVVATVELEATAEADLIDSIIASVQARLDDYRVGETVHHNHVLRCFFVDYATDRAFQGVHDVPTLTLSCKGNTISFGGHLDIEGDERVEPGDLTGITEVS